MHRYYRYSSGTTGPVPDQVLEMQFLVEPASDLPGTPLRYYPQVVVPVARCGTTGQGGSTGPKYRWAPCERGRAGPSPVLPGTAERYYHVQAVVPLVSSGTTG